VGKGVSSVEITGDSASVGESLRVGDLDTVAVGDLEGVGKGDLDIVGEGDLDNVGEGDLDMVGEGDLDSVGEGDRLRVGAIQGLKQFASREFVKLIHPVILHVSESV
jgi:hypothetical protein